MGFLSQLEGQGCPASISYKTYYDSDEVRACCECSLVHLFPACLPVCADIAEHSHEIGLANLPFTKRGRRAQAEEAQQGRTRSSRAGGEDDSSDTNPQNMSIDSNAVPGPSNGAPSAAPSPIPQPSQSPSLQTFQTAMAMMGPQQPQQPQQTIPISAIDPQMIAQDRWDRMGVLFQGIRENARSFEYPAPSIAALESILLRLYLESPINGSSSALAYGLPSPADLLSAGIVNGG